MNYQRKAKMDAQVESATVRTFLPPDDNCVRSKQICSTHLRLITRTSETNSPYDSPHITRQMMVELSWAKWPYSALAYLHYVRGLRHFDDKLDSATTAARIL